MKLLNILRKVAKKPTGFLVADVELMKAKARKIYNMDSMGGGYWGNSIKYFTIPKDIITGTILNVVGWKPNRPRPKDLLRMRLASGKVGIGVFVKVELCKNPADMFFGDVKMLGYDLNYES